MPGKSALASPADGPETDMGATNDTKRMAAEKIGFVSSDFVFSWLYIGIRILPRKE